MKGRQSKTEVHTIRAPKLYWRIHRRALLVKTKSTYLHIFASEHAARIQVTIGLSSTVLETRKQWNTCKYRCKYFENTLILEVYDHKYHQVRVSFISDCLQAVSENSYFLEDKVYQGRKLIQKETEVCVNI